LFSSQKRTRCDKYIYIVSSGDDLVAASETQDNMQCGVVLDAVVLDRTVIFQLLASPEQSEIQRALTPNLCHFFIMPLNSPHLIWWHTLLVILLHLLLDLVNCVGLFAGNGEAWSNEGLDENLHI
jgi:hypothetical protein